MCCSLAGCKSKLNNKGCSPSPPFHTHTHTSIYVKTRIYIVQVTRLFQAKDSFVPLFAALNIVADNSAGADPSSTN
jgi:hypothetical protein